MNEATAVAPLTDPAYRVIEARAADRGMAWLRGSVARFCEGTDHVRRRALAVAQMERIDLERLRRDEGDPTEILAEALGLPGDIAPDVAAVAACYQPHVTITDAADQALERVLASCGGQRNEQTAARIGLLVQAHAATTALVAGVNPPVPTSRRVDPSGETVLVDLTGFPFGAGVHACPGRAHALALVSSQLPFHRLHHRDTPLILPNAWDCASAAALVQAGFSAIGTTSLGVAAANGLPDAAAATLGETLDLAAKLARLPVPVTIDIESGLGARPDELAAQLWEMGVAGVNIEDGRGDHLADAAEQVELLRAFKDAAPALFLNARIDTHWLGLDPESTITRAEQYTDAGVDGVFVPGLADDRDIAAVVAATAVPLNVLAQGDPQRLANLGVRRISTGSLLFRAALGAAVTAAESVRDGKRTPQTPSYRSVEALAEQWSHQQPGRTEDSDDGSR